MYTENASDLPDNSKQELGFCSNCINTFGYFEKVDKTTSCCKKLFKLAKIVSTVHLFLSRLMFPC